MGHMRQQRLRALVGLTDEANGLAAILKPVVLKPPRCPSMVHHIGSRTQSRLKAIEEGKPLDPPSHHSVAPLKQLRRWLSVHQYVVVIRVLSKEYA